MACLGCGRQIENNSEYQMQVGNFIYVLCEVCFKKSGAVESCKRFETYKSKDDGKYRELLEQALSIVEVQEKNETLWIETTNPSEKILQRELRFLHNVIKSQRE